MTIINVFRNKIFNYTTFILIKQYIDSKYLQKNYKIINQINTEFY